MLRAQLEPAGSIRKKADRYARAAKAAGRQTPLNNFTVARYVYLADSRREAMDDLRADINYELGYQMKRGLIRMHHVELRHRRSRATRSLSISSPKPASITSAIRTRWRSELRAILRGLRRLRHAVDRDRQEMGDAREGVSLDAAVHGACRAEACATWCRCAIPTPSRRNGRSGGTQCASGFS